MLVTLPAAQRERLVKERPEARLSKCPRSCPRCVFHTRLQYVLWNFNLELICSFSALSVLRWFLCFCEWNRKVLLVSVWHARRGSLFDRTCIQCSRHFAPVAHCCLRIILSRGTSHWRKVFAAKLIKYLFLIHIINCAVRPSKLSRVFPGSRAQSFWPSYTWQPKTIEQVDCGETEVCLKTFK